MATADGSRAWEDLEEACMYGDPGQAARAVEAGADVAADAAAALRMLTLCAEVGNLPVLRALVEEHGAAPAGKDATGSTLLHRACRWGNVKVVLYLASEKCKIDAAAVNGDGETALHVACSYGHLNAAKALREACGVKMDVGVEEASESGSAKTPLVLAATNTLRSKRVRGVEEPDRLGVVQWILSERPGDVAQLDGRDDLRKDVQEWLEAREKEEAAAAPVAASDSKT